MLCGVTGSMLLNTQYLARRHLVNPMGYYPILLYEKEILNIVKYSTQQFFFHINNEYTLNAKSRRMDTMLDINCTL